MAVVAEPIERSFRGFQIFVIGLLYWLPLIERLSDGVVRMAQAQGHIGGIVPFAVEEGRRSAAKSAG